MKRRDFLASLLAGATASVLPSNLLASTNVWNTATLTSMLESMFACQMGPASALVYVNKDWIAEPLLMTSVDPIYPNQILKTYAPPPDGYEGYKYETYVAVVKGGTAEEAEAWLAKHFYEQFSKVPAGKLIWRTKPTFSSHEIVEFGETFFSQTQIEDFTAESIEFPMNVEFDFATEGFRYVKEKYTLHKMRMRVVLPEVYDVEIPAVPGLFKPEGSPIFNLI